MDMEICRELMGQTREQTPAAPTNNSNVCNWGNQIWEVNEGQQQHLVQHHPDPAPPPPPPHHQVMCLKLGKRHYFEDATGLMGSSGKRRKPTCLYTTAAADVPRCQVEGCHVPLLYAKDYHRRHRVCEMHSKAPKVVLLGLHQRFCQQCSRFHVISEFDDAKRSCRRRLAGHNERRRKTTTSHESVAQNKSMPTAPALSLLSSNDGPWPTSSDLSFRSSAALRELIAQNRAAILARQLSRDCWQPNHTDDFGFHQQQQQQEQGLYYEQQQQQQQHHGWERIHDENGGPHVTLDLMQAPNATFGLLSVRAKSKEELDQQECCYFWNSF